MQGWVNQKEPTYMVRGSASQELFRDLSTVMLCHIAPCPHSVIF